MTVIPQHIAIIMDGNGRWATERGFPRTQGHREGAKKVTRILEYAQKLGIHYITLYAFSTENWKRSTREVDTLLELFRSYLKKDLTELTQKDVKVSFIGDKTRFPQDIKDQMTHLENTTKSHQSYHLILGLSYSGRDELTRTLKKLATQVKDGTLDPASIDEALIAKNLDTSGIPDPDLMIRTSGEQRVSNFLLWQLAYTEMYFSNVLWPDFSEQDLDKAIEAYNKRERRFGGIKRE